MGRYFGGRFGDMLSPLSTSPQTKAILSMRDHYMMKKISGGGIQEPATNVTELNSLVSWSFLPNDNIYNSTGQQRTYYNCLLYTSPSPRDGLLSRMPSSA